MPRLLPVVLLAVLGGGLYVSTQQPQLLSGVLSQLRLPAVGNLSAPQTADQTGESPAAPGETRPSGEITERLFASDPMSIASQRARSYPGSAFVVRQTLRAGSTYSRQVVSYQSDGLRINALLTVPTGTPPKGGWPAIVFNHGYIPPDEYRTTERYVAYQDAFARAGFVTLKSDYRGHGSSQGEAVGGYYDPGYTTDVLNAAASLRRDRRVNAARLGMWGHSMGGQLTLRSMVVEPGWFRAGVIWAGVVAPYSRLQSEWKSGEGAGQTQEQPAPEFDPLNAARFRAISPNSYLSSLGGPLQLHQGTADREVPYVFQKYLADELQVAGGAYQAFRYEGDNHNLSGNLGLALRRSVAFFEANLKARK
ncbi:alpha/beta hydrolase family protein [Deinococcus altitudinis]|uniref:alpha/beta hydrolase family protein n=1 Tax=Deinococcus altitudinis TaxID=468914 RepID=UPI0038923359